MRPDPLTTGKSRSAAYTVGMLENWGDMPYPPNLNAGWARKALGVREIRHHPDWKTQSSREVGPWIMGPWHPQHIRIALWLIRGAKYRLVRRVVTIMLMMQGFSFLEACEAWGQAVDLAYLYNRGIYEPPWGLKPLVGYRWHRGKTVREYDHVTDSHERMWRRTCRMAWNRAVQIWRGHAWLGNCTKVPKEDWWKPWLACLDSMSVMPEYPMDAIEEVRSFTFVHPTVSFKQEVLLLSRWDDSTLYGEMDYAERRRWSWAHEKSSRGWRADTVFGIGYGKAFRWHEDWGWWGARQSGRQSPHHLDQGRELPPSPARWVVPVDDSPHRSAEQGPGRGLGWRTQPREGEVALESAG